MRIRCWVGRTFSHQPSVISHQPPAISHRPSAISHQPSATRHQTSAFWPSVINHQPPVPSVIGHYPSVSLREHEASCPTHSLRHAHQRGRATHTRLTPLPPRGGAPPPQPAAKTGCTSSGCGAASEGGQSGGPLRGAVRGQGGQGCRGQGGQRVQGVQEVTGVRPSRGCGKQRQQVRSGEGREGGQARGR